MFLGSFKDVESLNEVSYAILLHKSYRSYPSRRRACFYIKKIWEVYFSTMFWCIGQYGNCEERVGPSTSRRFECKECSLELIPRHSLIHNHLRKKHSTNLEQYLKTFYPNSVQVSTQTSNLLENRLKVKFRELSTSRREIVRLSQYCISSMRDSFEEVVKLIQDAFSLNKVNLMFLLHEMALESLNKNEKINRLVGESICHLLLQHEELLKNEKIYRCTIIWRKHGTLETKILRKIVDLIDSVGWIDISDSVSVVRRINSDTTPTPVDEESVLEAVASMSSTDKAADHVGSIGEGPANVGSVDRDVAISLDERLRKDFQIDLNDEDLEFV